jgi:hypothetical protein
LLVDHDPALLARVPHITDVETRVVDLASPSPSDRAIFEGRALVTASALLDLVSEDWLRGLVASCAGHGSAVLFALNYDGRVECTPHDDADEEIVALVNAHQRTDKGFGPAVGPDATACAAQCFSAAGYLVDRDRSDWVLTPASEELQRQLIEGWAHAAAEIAPLRRELIDGWKARRLEHVDANRSHLVVGHEDLAALRRNRGDR